MKCLLRTRTAASTLLIAVLIIFGGCVAGSKLINTGSSAITLKVWVILKSAEPIGDTQNEGCRLTIQEMTAIIEQLQSSASMYGTNVQILWNGTIEEVRDNFLPDRGGFSAATFSADVLRAILDNGPAFEPAAINIYFGGDYHLVSNPPFGQFALGATFDPATGSTFPAVIINDGGFDNFQGSDPQLIQDLQTVEHEMTHYLARFENRTFGNALQNTLRSYDDMEHVQLDSDDFGPNDNILLEGTEAQGQIRIRGIPGEAYVDSQNQGLDELGEISKRILQGRWNLGP